MKKRIVTGIAGAILGLYIATGAHALSTPQLPACADEDSHNCVWDAGTAGNGQGTSFIDYRGHVFYVDHNYDY